MNAIELEQLKEQSVLTQYQLQKEALVKLYADKISKLPVKWIQEEDKVYRVPSEEESLLSEELNEFLEILKKQLGIETLYKPIV